MMRGSTPTTALLMIFAFGAELKFFQRCFQKQSIFAAAPSFNPDELPAVTVPFSFLNAGLSFDSPSIVVEGFTNSS
jgi:hypothetical protein